jgi:hypothetical protein
MTALWQGIDLIRLSRIDIIQPDGTIRHSTEDKRLFEVDQQSWWLNPYVPLRYLGMGCIAAAEGQKEHRYYVG